MKPLIVAATRFEILETIPLLDEYNIPYVITGVGMTATAYNLTKYLSKNLDTSIVINVGIAGAFDKHMKLGEVISIHTDSFYELGAEDDEDFIPIHILGFGQNTYHARFSKDLGLLSYESITVNKIHGNDHSINKVHKLFPTVKIENMEGAAVFYTCAQENIDCIQIRAISNYVEKRNKSNWDIDLALKNLNNWLKNFITENY